jgi:hypothetical protein
VFKSLSVAALALVLAACGAPRPRQTTPPGPAEAVPRPELPTTRGGYHIDASQSELRVLVYRAGPLARFGHNHVMVNHSIRGTVGPADAAGAAVFSLIVPAAGFVVDDAQARSQEGPDFAGDIPEDAKSGTLRNMLSEAVLNADQFPLITVNCIATRVAQGAPGAPTSGTASLIATLAIRVAGHDSTIDAPFALEKDSDRLAASGSLELRQSSLGLTPYSLMLGALQVQDAMTIKFRIVAVPN